jgi:protein gp37
VWGPDAERWTTLSDKHWVEPLKWTGRVFSGSMCDVFEMNDKVVSQRERLSDLVDATPDLTWQLLTKRPENVPRLAPARWLADWPEHVWLGTSVEDQIRADIRVPRLLRVPGVTVRFLSVEPLLGPVDLTPWIHDIDWVIVGGESGPHHRPMDLDHARSIRDQCASAGVAFFFKQVGGRTHDAGGDQLDGRQHQDFPKVTSTG